MIMSLIIVNKSFMKKKKPNIHATNSMCANIYPLKYIYTLPIMALYCCLFLLIFAKFYSKQTKITFNIRCFKTSIGNFHLIFVVYIYIYVRSYKIIVQ